MRATALFVVASLAVAGCANHTWAPGPSAQVDFSVASGRCKLFAESGGVVGGFAAVGTPRFVAAAAVGSVVGTIIATSVRQNRLYNDCMEASGFVATDVQPATVTQAP